LILNSAYEKLEERQKDIQHKINIKLSDDIHRVQQLLVTMVEQRELNQYNTLHRIEKGTTSNSTKSAFIGDFARQNWYASLIMYNS